MKVESTQLVRIFLSESVSMIDGYRQTVALAWEENKMGFTIRVYSNREGWAIWIYN